MSAIVAKFQKLESREKALIGICAAVAVVFIIVFASRGCGGAKTGTSDLARAKKTREAFMADLARYQQMRQTVDRIDQKLASTPPGLDLTGDVSKIIEDLGLRPAIRNIKPGASTGTEFFSETYVDVDIQAIKLDDLVNLLKKLDESQAFIRVSQLSVKKRMGEDPSLDVNIRVAAYGEKQAEEAVP